MTSPLMQLEGVRKRFETATTDVLGGIDLEIHAGQSIAIVGPSGCGKSTLLNIIGGLLPQTAGSVRFAGTELSSLSPDALAAFRNREIGFVFQSHHLLPQCSALENVLIPTLADGARARARARAGAGAGPGERARALLAEVGLGDRLDHRPARMSGGECQRVAVVRALINEPRILLADEPTGSLDESSADHLVELLCRLNREKNVTLVTVTHAPRLAARMQATYRLHHGVLHGTPDGAPDRAPDETPDGTPDGNTAANEPGR